MSQRYKAPPYGLALFLLLNGIAPIFADELPAGFDCVITPSQTVDLSSPEPGQLRDVLVDRGDRVRIGQVVAALHSRLEEDNLSIARLRAETDTELMLRKTAFENDRRTEKRLSSLVASKAASVQQREQAEADARLSAWRVLQAEDDMKINRLELARAETALEQLRIRSSIDGLVAARLSDPGEYIDDQPLLRIVRLDPLHVEAILPMRLFGKIKPGMSGSVVSELSDASIHKATVVLVDPMGDAGSGTFGARLELSNPGEAIPAGVKCRVELDTNSIDSVN